MALVNISRTRIEEDTNKYEEKSNRKYSWILTLILNLIVFIIIIITGKNLVRRDPIGFFCNDPTISYPYKTETIGMIPLFVSVLIVPIFLFFAVECINLSKKLYLWRIILNHTWTYYKLFLIGLNCTTGVTQIIKSIFSELRPNFIDACQPDVAINCTIGFITEYTCTRPLKERVLYDLYKSFLSGHSSMIAYAAVFIILHLQHRCRKTFHYLLIPFLQITLVCLTIFCCLSRISDYRHHSWDVLAGVVLGCSIAVFMIKVLYKDYISPHRKLDINN